MLLRLFLSGCYSEFLANAFAVDNPNPEDENLPKKLTRLTGVSAGRTEA